MIIAKADQKDLQSTNDFLQYCEMFWDSRMRYCFVDPAEDWQQLDDGDEDKILLLKIRKDLSIEEGCREDDIDNRLIVYEFLKRKYAACDCNWRRVTVAADVLIQNVCDPQEDHLAFYPGFELYHVAPEM